MPPLIALLTDFGTSDPYVGVMKGVIAARCPQAVTIDITHEVSPQNVRQAAYLLRSAYRYFPPCTVFLVVVDPGVGTARRAVAIQTSHGLYVGPDNGVFSAVIEEIDGWQAVTLSQPERLSATFHGRDVFAPAAADLACGRPLNEMGIPLTDLGRIAWRRIEMQGPDMMIGEVIHIDHFGNMVTSLGPFAWQDTGRQTVLQWKPGQPSLAVDALTAQVEFGGRQLSPIRATYGETQPGDLLALINSDEQLEIAVNQGNAARLLGAKLGDTVRLHFQPEE
jgi:S-adenosylmethionine hydrolase